MLQRILGSHSQIYTTSEPWVMLHPLYSMKTTGIETEYSVDLAIRGLSEFLSQIDNGRTEYCEKMRQMYGSLYDRLLEPTGKKFFLDKTPRYYFIINELYDLFPDAKYIILIRNPLAVLMSVVDTWIKQDWFTLSRFKSDLLHAPGCLLKAITQLGDAGFRIQYEDILANPEFEIKKVCDYIGIMYDQNMIGYGNSGLPKWQYGDQKTVYEKGKPDALHSDKWTQYLKNPQVWRVMREYLNYLGEDRINRMGYSFSSLDEVLLDNEPVVDIDKTSVSLFALLDNTRDAFLEKKLLQLQLQQRDSQLRQKNEHIRQMDQRLHEQDQEIQNKNSFLHQKDHELRDKDQVIQSKESQIQQMGRQIQQIKEQIKNKDALLRQKDEQLDNRAVIINQKDQQIQDKDQVIQSKESQIQQMDQQIQRINEQTKKNDSLLRQKDEQMNNRAVKINQKDQQLKEIKNSYSYRVGKIIVFPASILKRLFKKIKKYDNGK